MAPSIRGLAYRLGRLLRRRLPGLGRDGDVWNLIPGEQYTGRHAESGGVTRQEQEAAIEDVSEQAAELEDAH